MSERPTRPAAEAPGHWTATAALALSTGLLYLSFARYGLNLDDEGNLLYQILRTYRGERPYLDFHTGYTPAMFYLNAGLMDLFGVSVMPLRLLLVLVNTAAVTLIFRLALRVAPVAEAALAALVYALFLPFFPGQFASFNIPYPAWYAITAWLLTELASVRSIETGKRSWLFAAGALAGLAFSFKPNTGVMALAAVVLTRLLTTGPLAGRLGAWLERTVLVVAFAGVFALLTFDVFTEQFLFLGVPILLLIGGAAYLRDRARGAVGVTLRPVAAGFLDVGALLLGFGLVIVVWLAYFLPLLGLERFGREVLLLGAGVERIYLLYYPDGTRWTVAVAALLVLAWLVPGALRAGWLGKSQLLVGGLLLALVAGAAVAVFGLAPEGFIVSIGLQLENLSYFLIPALLVGAVLLVLWRLGRPPALEALARGALEPRLAVVIALVVYGLFLFVQLYPRIDFMHVVIGMPSALVLAAGALDRLARWWWGALEGGESTAAPRGSARLWVRMVVLLPIVVGLGSRATAFVDARVGTEGGLHVRPMTRLPFDAMPVELELDRDHDLRELAAVTQFIADSTVPGEAIVTFPALAIIPYMADRTTPFAHDYFFAGRPSHADEAEMVEQIAEVSPAFVVTLNERLGYFSAAPAYYFILRDFVLENYVLVRRFGRFDVLMRRDLAAQRPQWADAQGGSGRDDLRFAGGRFLAESRAASALAARGGLEDLHGMGSRLADPDRGVRRVWAAAFEAVAAREEGGLSAVEAVVAPDPRSRLLFVRTLGEYADTRSLPYLQQMFLEGEGRLRWESARSINFILARKLADRFRLYDPPQGPLWDLPGDLPPDEMVALVGDFAERQRIGPLAALAVAESDRADLADALEYFESDRETTWWRMIAALSLVDLGRSEHLRTMLETLNTGTLAAQYVPSLLLDPELISREEVAAALEQTVEEGTAEEKETVAWMLPYVDGVDVAPVVALLRQDPDPAVRRAADWAHERMAAPFAVPAPSGAGGNS